MKNTAASPAQKHQEAKKLFMAHYGLRPMNAIDRLLKARDLFREVGDQQMADECSHLLAARGMESETHSPAPWGIRMISWEDGQKQLQIVTLGEQRPEYAAATTVVALTPRYNLHTGRFDRNMADARLIAAAPEQHEALKAISNDCKAWLNDEMDMSADDLLAAIQSAADTAIAKAKGRAA